MKNKLGFMLQYQLPAIALFAFTIFAIGVALYAGLLEGHYFRKTLVLRGVTISTTSTELAGYCVGIFAAAILFHLFRFWKLSERSTWVKLGFPLEQFPENTEECKYLLRHYAQKMKQDIEKFAKLSEKDIVETNAIDELRMYQQAYLGPQGNEYPNIAEFRQERKKFQQKIARAQTKHSETQSALNKVDKQVQNGFDLLKKVGIFDEKRNLSEEILKAKELITDDWRECNRAKFLASL